MNEYNLSIARSIPAYDLELDQQRLVSIMDQREVVSPDNDLYATTPINPDRFRNTLGGILPYFRDVEYLVKDYALELDSALGPDEFRQHWLREEVPHGLTIDRILQNSGVVEPLPELSPPGTKFLAIGALKSKFPVFGDMLGLISSKVGHINEAMNINGQTQIIQTAIDIEERQIAKTFGAMTRQERTHDRWYINDVALREQRLREQNKGWLITIADHIASKQFPVGANTDEMKQRFGGVVTHLAEGDVDSFLESARKLIAEVYANKSSSAKSHITKTTRMVNAYQICFSQFEQAN